MRDFTAGDRVISAPGLHWLKQRTDRPFFCWIHLYDAPPQAAGGLIESDGRRKPGFFAWKSG